MIGGGWIALIAGVILALLAVITYGVRAIINGDLISRKQSDAMQKMSDDQRDREREINDLNTATNINIVTALSKTTDQLAAVVNEQRTTTEIVVALKHASDIASKGVVT